MFGGFEDTQLGPHVDHALHAIGVDERRRPFTPTFWTVKKGDPLPSNIEQNWFPGVHCNVGGGYPESGLSDIALIWMIARTQALTGLSFDEAAIRRALKPNIDGNIPNSAEKYPIDRNFPRSREMFPAGAPANSLVSASGDPAEEQVNEKVHWSVLAKLGRSCNIYGAANSPLRSSKPERSDGAARLDLAGRVASITRRGGPIAAARSRRAGEGQRRPPARRRDAVSGGTTRRRWPGAPAFFAWRRGAKGL